jgi:hypothetical protein
MSTRAIRQTVAAGAVLCLMSGALLSPAVAQEGIGEKIGERIDRGLRKIGSELRQEWAEIRRSVERMGVQGRVYSRMRWDKNLQGASINIEVAEEKIVVLQGKIPSDAAKQKALELARDTVGVESVVDELTIEEAP